jgi:glycosyltransferase involved in cell wall biosynthesis
MEHEPKSWTHSMKILFVWRKMGNVAGGVERMATTMMNEMIRRGHDVSLLTWDSTGAQAHYPMSKRILWHCLDLGDPVAKAGWRLRLKRMIKTRALVKTDKPDVIICFEHGIFLSMYLFLFGFFIPMIAAERNAPSRFYFLGGERKKKIVSQVLRLADKVTVQFERYRDGYPDYLRKKIVAIHNPVTSAVEFAVPSGEKEKTKTLLCVGRLAYQKNIDVLIQTFAALSSNFPTWNLLIVGDGEDRKKLEDMITHLDMSERIALMPSIKNVQSLYCSAHLFCLPSRWEGFPNALAEAMAHGLPSVGFAGCSGVSDLIEDNRNGFLAEGNDDAATLASALKDLMADDEKREQFGWQARESMTQYAPELIFTQWERLFVETAQR